jgi:hypothetical protein
MSTEREEDQCPMLKAGEQCLGVRGHDGRHQYASDPPPKKKRLLRTINPHAKPINSGKTSELTTAGTIRVRATGYLVGDEVPVLINGQSYPSKVVKVTATMVEVEPQVPNLVELVTGTVADDLKALRTPTPKKFRPWLQPEPWDETNLAREHGQQIQGTWQPPEQCNAVTWPNQRCTLPKGHREDHHYPDEDKDAPKPEKRCLFAARCTLSAGHEGLHSFAEQRAPGDKHDTKAVLRRQLRELYTRPHADKLVHMWLCHPGRGCADGCDTPPIPERLAIHEELQRPLFVEDLPGEPPSPEASARINQWFEEEVGSKRVFPGSPDPRRCERCTPNLDCYFASNSTCLRHESAADYLIRKKQEEEESTPFGIEPPPNMAETRALRAFKVLVLDVITSDSYTAFSACETIAKWCDLNFPDDPVTVKETKKESEAEYNTMKRDEAISPDNADECICGGVGACSWCLAHPFERESEAEYNTRVGHARRKHQEASEKALTKLTSIMAIVDGTLEDMKDEALPVVNQLKVAAFNSIRRLLKGES